MNGFAGLAITPAAHASGLGQGLLPGMAPSLVDGFAVGALLSAACVLLVLVSRRGMRPSRLAARDADWTKVAHVAVNPGHLGHAAAPASSDPLAESAEVVMYSSSRAQTRWPADAGNAPRQSGYRLADWDTTSRPRETRRSAGRHAAKSARVGL
jgi:hypothetical protein